MQEHVTLLGPEASPADARGLSSSLPPDLMEQVRGRVRLLALLLLVAFSVDPLIYLAMWVAATIAGYPVVLGQLGFRSHPRKQVFMQSLKALIERTNRKALKQVDVRVTITDSTSGRQPSWRGEFMSRTADGFLPSERIWLTLDNGQRGMANISETHFNSRTPEATLIQFMGKGPLV